MRSCISKKLKIHFAHYGPYYGTAWTSASETGRHLRSRRINPVNLMKHGLVYQKHLFGTSLQDVQALFAQVVLANDPHEAGWIPIAASW
jgi:hypothetical protein